MQRLQRQTGSATAASCISRDDVDLAEPQQPLASLPGRVGLVHLGHEAHFWGVRVGCAALRSR